MARKRKKPPNSDHSNDESLPKGWSKHTSSKHNRVFYHNKQTGKSVWKVDDIPKADSSNEHSRTSSRRNSQRISSHGSASSVSAAKTSQVQRQSRATNANSSGDPSKPTSDTSGSHKSGSNRANDKSQDKKDLRPQPQRPSTSHGRQRDSSKGSEKRDDSKSQNAPVPDSNQRSLVENSGHRRPADVQKPGPPASADHKKTDLPSRSAVPAAKDRQPSQKASLRPSLSIKEKLGGVSKQSHSVSKSSHVSKLVTSKASTSLAVREAAQSTAAKHERPCQPTSRPQQPDKKESAASSSSQRRKDVPRHQPVITRQSTKEESNSSDEREVSTTFGLLAPDNVQQPSVAPSFPPKVEEDDAMDWDSVDPEAVIGIIAQDIRQPAVDSCQWTPVKSSHPNFSPTCIQGHAAPILVLDTNILISHLNLCQQIIHNEASVLAIPWIVLQELDKLKVYRDDSVSAKCRKAIAWLEAVAKEDLHSQNSRIVFQRLGDLYSVNADWVRGPDDEILMYSVFLKEKACMKNLALLTNDKNLATKSISQQVQAMNSAEAEVLLKAHVDKTGGCKEPLNAYIVKELTALHQEQKGNESCGFSEASRICYQLLEDFLIDEMKGVYDSDWKTIIKVKPKETKPHFSTSSIFIAFEKHKIAVFSINFEATASAFFKQLDRIKKLLRYYEDESQTADLIRASISLCELIIARKCTVFQKSAAAYRVKLLKMLTSNAKNPHGDTATKLSDKSETAVQKVQNVNESIPQTLTVLSRVWECILVITHRLCEIFGVEWQMPLPDTVMTGHFDQAYYLKFAGTFYSVVNQLCECYHVLLNSTSLPSVIRNTKLNEFCEILMNFRSITAQVDLHPWTERPIVTPVMVEEFLYCDSARAENGFQQMMTLREKLEMCSNRVAQQLIACQS